MSSHDRGFASMSKDRQREIAHKGGVVAHLKGTAHEWTHETAKKAGEKGGLASRGRPRTRRTPVQEPTG